MYCPKCGIENPDNAKVCNSCNWVLISTSTSAPNPDTKTSGLAIASFVLGILSVLFAIFTAIPAIILGIISLVKISKSAGQLKGKGFAIVGIAIPAVWLPLSLLLLLIPGLSNARRHTIYVKQMAQLLNIDTALELFKNEFGDYPPSDALDPAGKPYCGAMKLCEAMMGRDLLGFHRYSDFRRDGMNAEGTIKLYPGKPELYDQYIRKGPYLPPENANAFRLNEIFENVGPFDGNNLVICDTYAKKRRSGRTIGMPVLYYRANASTTAHDISNPDNPENIYNYKDNHALLALGVPGKKHPLFEDPTIFYKMTRNYKVTTQSIPNRADNYILLSAGYDGLYGTKDDVVNFDMGWKK